MVMPAIKEQILNDLDRLSPEKQKRAADLVHGLLAPPPRGASVEELMTVVGTLDDESANEMKAAIEEGCELVRSTARMRVMTIRDSAAKRS